MPPIIAPINLKDKITAALTNPDSELWFPDLTFDLMRSGLQKLSDETGITEAEYGTARVILKAAGAAQHIAYTFMFPDGDGSFKTFIPVEILPVDFCNQYKESGVSFFTAEDLFERDVINAAKGTLNNEILNCVKDAFKIIRQVPSLFYSVCCLVKSIHLIKSEDDEYDISFSEPHIPFSIFISVPQKNTPVNALRVAEAIVHEAMHLQLTLIENVVPLLVPGGELVYSPWKEEYRTPQGVLHAIYVFKVIDCFFKQLIQKAFLELENKNSLLERVRKISCQINEIILLS